MKELSGTARNFALVVEDGEYHPVVELIYIVSEPQYRFACGEMVRERTPETIRISTNRGGVKRLLEQLTEIDKEFAALERAGAASELFGEAKSHHATQQGTQAAKEKDAASGHC